MKTFINKSILGATVIVAAIGFTSNVSAEQVAGAAVAETGISVQSVSISYAAAELSTATGRANLYGKIKHAAREVCGPSGLRETGSLSIASRNRKCYNEAVDAAKSQVDSVQVAAIGG